MNDLLETITEVLAAIKAEQEKLKQTPSAYLALAHGGLATAQDNLRHEIDRREKAAAASDKSK